MALEDKEIGPGEYELIREGKEEVMKINFSGLSYSPSIENDPYSMAFVVDRLIEVPSTDRIILSSDRNYQYVFDQIQMLREIKIHGMSYMVSQLNIQMRVIL